MIIKELQLNNFACYYDNNKFEFESGLNLILGHNGDGKSTIFLAFKWIFDSIFQINLEALVSAKKISEISLGESFDVSVELKVEQYQEEVTIEKRFTVLKKESSITISPIKETVYILDKISGESSTDNNIRFILDRIFPIDYRLFSMFETEVETLNIVDSTNLYKLINSFSDSKYFDAIELKAKQILTKAEKALRNQNTSSTKINDEIESIEAKIEISKKEVKRLKSIIEQDLNGLNAYKMQIEELSRHSHLSIDIKAINDNIEELEKEEKRLQLCIKNKFTNYIFDDLYCLVGYKKYYELFYDKIDQLRLARNKEYDLQIRLQIEDEGKKLSLKNGITPLPPGSPSVQILSEFIDDNICKICGTELTEESKDYIEKSLAIYKQAKEISKNGKNEKQIIFHNQFINELSLLQNIIETDVVGNSLFSLKKLIEEKVELNNSLTEKIEQCHNQLQKRNQDKEDILKQTKVHEEKLINLLEELPHLSNKQSQLHGNISKNKTLLDLEIKHYEALEEKKNRTLAQLPPSEFKIETIQMLQNIEKIFRGTKTREYNKFLKVLEEKATTFLVAMNPGEITGVIKLERTEDSVSFISLNNDGTVRTTLDNSGALKISIPMSILFAIAELAGEIREENYPMIFDAPTGRFSPERRIAFYNAVYNTSKQRIIMTIDCLNDKNGIPYVDQDSFSKIKKHKAFWVIRERPFKEDDKATINTNVEKI